MRPIASCALSMVGSKRRRIFRRRCLRRRTKIRLAPRRRRGRKRPIAPRVYDAGLNERDLSMVKVYLNGKLVDKLDAKVSVYDHALLYGDGVFEGIRIYSGKAFKLK